SCSSPSEPLGEELHPTARTHGISRASRESLEETGNMGASWCRELLPTPKHLVCHPHRARYFGILGLPDHRRESMFHPREKASLAAANQAGSPTVASRFYMGCPAR